MSDSTAQIALENETDGKVRAEIERVFYARLLDTKTLSNAQSHEDQEQWEIKIPKTDENAAAGRMRVRKITYADGRVEFIRTTKMMLDGVPSEVEFPSSEDEFNMFKAMAPVGMDKRRYYFPIPGREERFEVDVFRNPDGDFYRWIKIDLEIPNPEDPPPLKFPDGLIDEESLCQASSPEPEKKALVQELYSRIFLTKNAKAVI